MPTLRLPRNRRKDWSALQHETTTHQMHAQHGHACLVGVQHSTLKYSTAQGSTRRYDTAQQSTTQHISAHQCTSVQHCTCQNQGKVSRISHPTQTQTRWRRAWLCLQTREEQVKSSRPSRSRSPSPFPYPSTSTRSITSPSQWPLNSTTCLTTSSGRPSVRCHHHYPIKHGKFQSRNRGYDGGEMNRSYAK